MIVTGVVPTVPTAFVFRMASRKISIVVKARVARFTWVLTSFARKASGEREETNATFAHVSRTDLVACGNIESNERGVLIDNASVPMAFSGTARI